MVSAITYESGHIYRILNTNYKRLHNSYIEYESFFYEFNLLLWLIENNIYKEKTLIISYTYLIQSNEYHLDFSLLGNLIHLYILIVSFCSLVHNFVPRFL